MFKSFWIIRIRIRLEQKWYPIRLWVQKNLINLPDRTRNIRIRNNTERDPCHPYNQSFSVESRIHQKKTRLADRFASIRTPQGWCSRIWLQLVLLSSRVVNLAILKSVLKFWLFWTLLAFFGNQKTPDKIWPFFSRKGFLGSGRKTITICLTELHLHCKVIFWKESVTMQAA